MDLNNFFLEGFVKDKIDYDISQFDDWPFLEDKSRDWAGTADQQVELAKLASHVSHEIVGMVFDDRRLLRSGLWQGVDAESQVWHNDWRDGDEFNSNFLIYLDDNDISRGNYIGVRGQDFEYCLEPRRGEFVWLNQSEMFEHRASNQQGLRRIIVFEFYIPGLVS